MSLTPGQSFSHYRIVGKIGEGGMGIVYRAEDTRLRRHVALKILPDHVVSHPDRRHRFLREARTTAAVSHPGIATVYEIDELDGTVFIGMELIEGRSLRQVIAGPPLSLEDVLRLSLEMAEALVEAHRAGVVHRDFKPENVMLTRSGHAKILDFGLAKLVRDPQGTSPDGWSRMTTLSGEITGDGWILGTPAYMSPEQALGRPVDARTDIFAFGAVLYELTTGRRAFSGAIATEVIDNVLHADPESPDRIRPALPAGWVRVIEKALRKDPVERYQNMEELAADLRHLANVPGRDGTSGQKPSRPALPRPPIQRSAPHAWIAAVIVCLASMATILSWIAARRSEGGRPGARVVSIAVLPLKDLSGDANQEYFADGMTDALITNLSKIRALTVISRTSSMRFKDADKPIPEIGHELGVDAVVEGVILRVGDRVRISAQLVEAATQGNLWAESYERRFADVLSLQQDVARAIATEIRVQITQQEETRLAASRPVNTEAYEHTLKGHYHMRKYTREGFDEAKDAFLRAVDLDPGFGPAHAGLAAYYYEISSVLVPATEGMPRAKDAARRALECDPDLAEAVGLLAVITAAFDWEWERAGPMHQRAIELNPGDASIRNRYGVYLNNLGRLEEARVQLAIAQRLDPLSSYMVVGTIWPDLFAPPGKRRYAAALDGLRRAVEMDPAFPYARLNLALVHQATGHLDLAVEEIERAIASQDTPYLRLQLARLHALAGDRAGAEALLDATIARKGGDYVSPARVAVTVAALGDLDKAFDWVEKAIDERDESLAFFLGSPEADLLRDDPRFAAVLRRIGLTP